MKSIKKMFSILVFIKIIVYYCVNGSLDPSYLTSDDNRSEIVEGYINSHNLEREYFVSDLEETKNMFDHQLLREIRRTYTEVKCSYIITSMIYMQLLKYFLNNKDEIILTSLDDFSFVYEAAKMLATMHNHRFLNSGCDLMWIFYMYTNRVHQFIMKSALYKDQDYLENNIEILKIHDIVYEILENSMKAYTAHLTGYSKKNLPYMTNIERYINDSAKNITHMHPKHWLMIKNKKKITHQVFWNSGYGINYTGYELITLENLQLNQKINNFDDVIRILVAEFGLLEVIGQQFSNTLRILFYEAKDSENILSKQIKSLSLFQYHYIQMFHICMLRLLLKHLMALKELFSLTQTRLWSPKKIFTLQKSNKIMHDALTKFLRMFNMKKDKDMIKIYQVFETNTLRFCTVKKIDALMEYVVSSIDKIPLKQIENFKCSDLTSLRKWNIENPLSELQKVIKRKFYLNTPYNIIHVILKTEEFIKYVKNIVGDFDFNIVHSFIQVKLSSEFHILENKENDKSFNLH